MERPRRPNAGTGVDTLETSFDGKIYVHGQNQQFMMTKEKYYTKKTLIHIFL